MVKTADGQLMPVHIPAAMPAAGAGVTAAAATATAAAGAPGSTLPLATINASNIVGPNAAATAAALNLPLIGGVSPPGQTAAATAAQLQLPGSGNVNQTIIKQEVINPSNSFVTSLGVTSTTGNSSVSLTTKQVSFTFSSQPTCMYCVLHMLGCTVILVHVSEYNVTVHTPPSLTPRSPPLFVRSCIAYFGNYC